MKLALIDLVILAAVASLSFGSFFKPPKYVVEVELSPIRVVLSEALSLRMPGDLRLGLNLSMVEMRFDEESRR